MSGFTAGLVSIASLIVGGSILATFLKNPQGTTALVGGVGTAFDNSLVASQGNVTSLSSYPGGY